MAGFHPQATVCSRPIPEVSDLLSPFAQPPEKRSSARPIKSAQPERNDTFPPHLAPLMGWNVIKSEASDDHDAGYRVDCGSLLLRHQKPLSARMLNRITDSHYAHQGRPSSLGRRSGFDPLRTFSLPATIWLIPQRLALQLRVMWFTRSMTMSASRTDSLHARFWDDLTGRSPRWMRTFFLGLVLGKLSSVLVGLAIRSLGFQGEEQFSGAPSALSGELIFSALVFAPLFESLAVLGVFWLLARKSRRRWPVWSTALACAVLSIPLHGLSAYSVLVAPFFALMAAIQHNWMDRGEATVGFWLIVSIHFVANGLSVLATAMLGP